MTHTTPDRFDSFHELTISKFDRLILFANRLITHDRSKLISKCGYEPMYSSSAKESHYSADRTLAVVNLFSHKITNNNNKYF
jgi:hypothetical protein